MTDIAIIGVGLVTARGSVHDLAGDASPPVPMPWHPARRYRPLRGIHAAGRARLIAAMQAALAECGGTGPILAASCNGAAATWRTDDWRASFDLGHELGGGPVASAACASGMHALYLARQLIAAGASEIRVVAADIVTPPSHDNFESLRLLSDDPAPFQPDASGFLLGEAAVALRLVLAAHAPDAPRLIGPVLGHDLDGDDGIARALHALRALAASPARPSEPIGGDLADRAELAAHIASDKPSSPGRALSSQPSARIGADLVIGQGTGPAEFDRLELAAIAAHLAPDVPLATALPGFGHALGASSLLSVALAVLSRDSEIAALAASHSTALDGRPLGARRSRRTVVVCRALGGACGACLIGDAAPPLPALRVTPAGPQTEPGAALGEPSPSSERGGRRRSCRRFAIPCCGRSPLPPGPTAPPCPPIW